MDKTPLGRGELPFKIPSEIDAIKAIDATFWQLHAQWRTLEDEFENYPGFPDEDPEAERLLDMASAARDAMFLRGVWTGAALMAKLAAIEEGQPCSVIDMQLTSGITVFDVLKWDAERIFQREAGLADPAVAG